ncbi:MAG: glycosyltransferase, partial [Candidatus Aegiribacteria sp.]|nr:glycosyltransferase [Candidatus Aegiribacteria sp.]MBD3293947.1 glycosyltransferase [Candidatus Fermentibacteria bacterium]
MRSEEYSPSYRDQIPLIYAGALTNRGGTGVYTRRLLEGLDAVGARVRALAGGLVMSPKEALEHEIPEKSVKRTAREYLKNPALLRKIRPSVVHLPSFSGRVPADIPFIVTVHDLAFARKPDWFPFFKSVYYRLHFSSVAKKADIVMVDSEFTGTEARELLGIPENRIRRVYLSTCSFQNDPALFTRRFSLTGQYIVYAGT